MLRMRRNRPDMISRSLRAWPGGSAACQCHCKTREELTSEPRSSAKQLVGRRNTSVMILVGSTSWYCPCAFQNSPVSTASGSIMTRNFSLDSASVTFCLFGADASTLKPWQI
ncbi:hypothetical protein D3C85_568340 [compost metagenome]